MSELAVATFGLMKRYRGAVLALARAQALGLGLTPGLGRVRTHA